MNFETLAYEYIGKNEAAVCSTQPEQVPFVQDSSFQQVSNFQTMSSVLFGSQDEGLPHYRVLGISRSATQDEIKLVIALIDSCLLLT